MEWAHFRSWHLAPGNLFKEHQIGLQSSGLHFLFILYLLLRLQLCIESEVNGYLLTIKKKKKRIFANIC
jgi:hypothetical protein